MKRYVLFLMLFVIFCVHYSPMTTAQTDKPPDDYPVITAENVAGLQQLRVLGEGYINDVIFSPDEQFVAMATTVGIWLYSIDDLENPIYLFGDYAINVTYAMFSPDGSRLFGGTSNGWIYIWDVANMEQIAELGRIPNEISYFQLSEDEKYLYVMSNDLTIWNLDGNYLERSIAFESSLSVLSPDSKYLIKEIYLRDTREWKTGVVDTNTGELLYFLEESFYYPRFDESVSYIVSVDAESNADAFIWDVQTGTLLYDIGEHSRGVRSIYSKPNRQEDNRYIPMIDGVILSKDQTKVIMFDAQFNVQVWDIAIDRLLYTFSPQNEILEDNIINTFEFITINQNVTESEVRQFIESENLIARIMRYFSHPEYRRIFVPYRISSNETYISSYSSTSMFIWNVQTHELIFNLPSNRHCGGGGTSSLALDNTRLISRSPYGYGVCVLDFENQNIISIYSYTTTSLGNMISDGKHIAVVNTTFEGDALEQIIIWNLETNTSIEIEEELGYMVFAHAVFSPNSEYLAISNGQATIFLFNPETGELIHRLSNDTHPAVINKILISPDSRLLAVTFIYPLTMGDSAGAGQINIWDLESGKLVSELRGHNRSVSDLEFSLDSHFLLTSSYDDTVYLWDLEKKEAIFIFSDYLHKGAFGFVNFNYDGSLLALKQSSPFMSDFVSIFDAQTGTQLFRLSAIELYRYTLYNQPSIIGMDFSPTENLIAVAINDGTVEIWNGENGQLLNTIFIYNMRVMADSFNVAYDMVSFNKEGNLIIVEMGDGVTRIFGVPEA